MEGGVRSMLTYFPHLQQFVAVALIAFLHALWKLCKEWVLLIVVFLIDLLMAFCWTTLPFITVVCAIAMIAVEVLSMVEHARLRKDKITKLPSQLKDLVEYLGEDDVKEMLRQFAKRKLNIE